MRIDCIKQYRYRIRNTRQLGPMSSDDYVTNEGLVAVLRCDSVGLAKDVTTFLGSVFCSYHVFGDF